MCRTSLATALGVKKESLLLVVRSGSVIVEVNNMHLCLQWSHTLVHMRLRTCHIVMSHRHDRHR